MLGLFLLFFVAFLEGRLILRFSFRLGCLSVFLSVLVSGTRPGHVQVLFYRFEVSGTLPCMSAARQWVFLLFWYVQVLSRFL